MIIVSLITSKCDIVEENWNIITCLGSCKIYAIFTIINKINISVNKP